MVRFVGVSASAPHEQILSFNIIILCIHRRTASIATYNPCRDADQMPRTLVPDDPAEWKNSLLVPGPIKSEYLINLVQ